VNSSRFDNVWQTQRRGMASLWRGFTSPYTLLAVTLVAFLGALLNGLWFHGATGESAGEIAAMARPGSLLAQTGWLANLYASWRWSNILDSWLGRVLLAMVTLVVLWQLLHAWFPAWATPPARLTSTHWLTFPYSATEAFRRLEQAFALGGRRLIRVRGARGRLVRSAPNESQPSVILAVAERAGLARWVSGLFYLGVLLLVLSVLISHRWSWSSPRLDLALGETRPLGQGDSLALRLEKIEIFPGSGQGAPAIRSTLYLLQGARIEDEIILRQGRPQDYQGLRIYQVGLGPAARVTAKNASGEALAIQSLFGDTALQRSIRVRLSGQQQEQQLALPDADMVLRMVQYSSLPQQGYGGSVLHVQLLRGTDGQLLEEKFLTESGSLSSGGVSADIALEYFISVRAQREPELPLLVTAGALMVVGVVGLMLWPPQRAWLMVEEYPQGSVCQMVVARRDAESPWFTCARSLLAEAAHE
jgi:hypothetical protein